MDSAHLDEEIKKQWEVLSNLYSQKNALAPVYRLPSETLTTIFILYACGRPPYSSHLKVPGWVNVSYVCRRWRNAALNCPTLWSYAFMVSKRWTEELMARSKQTPLKISVNPSPIASRVHESVADHVERIEELRLQLAYANKNDRLLSKLYSSPAPRLRILEVSDLARSEDPSLLLFQGETPALRELTLLCCSMPWYSFTLSGLTTLKIRDVRDPFRLHMVEFLAALGRMPFLVRLDLSGALASASNFLSIGAVDTTPRSILPCLSFVAITAPLSAIVAFLSCVNIPMKAQLTLSQSDCHQSTLDEYNRFLSLLTQRFIPDDLALRVELPTIRSLVIRNSQPVKLDFSTSEETSTDLEGEDSNYPLRVTLGTSYLSQLDDERIIDDICHSLPLTNTQNLFFDYPPRSSGFWRSILGLMPDLRNIELYRGHVPDIISVLSWTSETSTRDSDPGQGSNPTFVPLLEMLTLEDVVLSEWTEPCFELESLADALNTRTQSQCLLIATQCRQAIDYCRYKQVECDSSWEDGKLVLDIDESVPSETDSEPECYDDFDGDYSYDYSEI